MVRPWQETILLIFLAVLYSKPVETAIPTNVIQQTQFYKDFIEQIYTEEKFENCLIFGELRESKTLNLLLRVVVENFTKPIILQNPNNSYQIGNLFNRKILVIARLECLEDELSMLAYTLNRMRQKRIILVDTGSDLMSKHAQHLAQLFRLCEAEKMLNVVAIFADFPQTKTFYSYTIFPTFQLEEKTLGTAGVEVFPRRLKNLRGYGIRTMPDQIFPFSYAYELDGRIQVGGYLQKLLEAFAASINAKLFYPFPIKLKKHDPAMVVNMTYDNVIDIPASNTYLLRMQDFDRSSMPFGISSVCIVTPIKWYHTLQNFYQMYLNSIKFPIYLVVVGFLTITLRYCCQRLLCKLDGRPCHLNFWWAFTKPNYYTSNFELGNRPKLPRLLTVRVVVFISMIWALCIPTHFTANLNSFLTKPVLAPNPKTWDDLNRLDYKVLFSADFFQYILQLCDDFCTNTERSWVFVDTLEELQHECFKMNTSYAYPTDRLFWHFVKLKMRSLKQPIFHLTDMCFKRHIFSSIHLPENSIFTEHLNLFLTRCADHGLYKIWLDLTYLETERYKIQGTLPETVQLERPLDMAYMSSVWKMLGVVWIMSILIFACEVVIGRCQRKSQSNNNVSI